MLARLTYVGGGRAVVCAQMSSVSSLLSSCASLFGFGASHTDESQAQPAGGAAAPPPAVIAAQAEAGTASAPPPLPPPGAVAAPFPQPPPPPPAAAAAAADCGAGVGLLPVASSHGSNGQCVQPAAAAAHMPVCLPELSEAQISSMATPELRDTAKALGFSGLGRAHELKRQILAEMQRRNIPMQQHQQFSKVLQYFQVFLETQQQELMDLSEELNFLIQIF